MKRRNLFGLIAALPLFPLLPKPVANAATTAIIPPPPPLEPPCRIMLIQKVAEAYRAETHTMLQAFHPTYYNDGAVAVPVDPSPIGTIHYHADNMPVPPGWREITSFDQLTGARDAR